MAFLNQMNSDSKFSLFIEYSIILYYIIPSYEEPHAEFIHWGKIVMYSKESSVSDWIKKIGRYLLKDMQTSSCRLAHSGNLLNEEKAYAIQKNYNGRL